MLNYLLSWGKLRSDASDSFFNWAESIGGVDIRKHAAYKDTSWGGHFIGTVLATFLPMAATKGVPPVNLGSQTVQSGSSLIQAAGVAINVEALGQAAGVGLGLANLLRGWLEAKGTNSGSEPYRNPAVERAIKDIDTKIKAGEKNIEIHVASRSEAEEIFYKRFYPERDPAVPHNEGRAYINTTDFGGPQASQDYLDVKVGTYHWDDVLDPASGKIVGHSNIDAEHAKYPHLQIETWTGNKIRLIWK